MSALGSATTTTIVPLTSQEEQLIKLHSDSTWRGSKNRIGKYLDEHPRTKVVVYRISAAAAIAGGIGGAIIGAKVGGVVAPPGGIIPGAFAGGVLGALAAGVSVPMYVYLQKNSVKRYMDWKTKAIEDKLYPLYQQIIESNDFAGLVCPISKELPNFPVKALCGHVFEKDQIEEWLRKKPASETSCPNQCKEQFTRKDLVYSQAHLNKISIVAKAAIKKLVKQQEESGKITDESQCAIEGLKEKRQISKSHSVDNFESLLEQELEIAAAKNLTPSQIAKVGAMLYASVLSPVHSN